jgi:uncharacterized protein (DUF305 family)
METKTLISALIALVVGLVLGFIAAPRFGGMDHDGMMQNMQGMDHSQMGGGMTMGTPKGDQGEASKAYAKANAAMHTGMDITFTGNADVDFAKGMIPHHQGAIDMAKIVLQYGKDAEIRTLAEGIVKAQEGEIAFMNAWLAKNGG